MNEFTNLAAEAAASAVAYGNNISADRARLFAEAHALASVSDAIDHAELLAITKATSMEKAMAVFDLAPRETLIDPSHLSEEAQKAIEYIVAMDADPEAEARAVFYDAREGEGFAAQRLAAAASILGLEGPELLVILQNALTLDAAKVDAPALDAAAELFSEAKAGDRAPSEKKAKKGKKS